MPLHKTDEAHIPQTVCHHPDHYDLERRFIMADDRGYGDHPVLWYRESIGILDMMECSRFFEGNRCKDAWHKDFFSKEIELPNHSCVHKPPGCDEAYSFPADGERCSVHTKKGEKRIAHLCRQEQDARLAWEGMLENESFQSFLLTGRGPQQLQRAINSPPTVNSMRGTDPTMTRIVQDPTMPHPLWRVNLACLIVGLLVSSMLLKKPRVRIILRQYSFIILDSNITNE